MLTRIAFSARTGLPTGPLHGLQIAAVAVVAQAVWSMAGTLAPDRARGTLAIGAAVTALLVPTPLTQVAIIAAAAVLGWRLLPVPSQTAATPPVPVGRRLAAGAGGLFVAPLLGLPLLRSLVPAQPLALLDSFYRTGALVFGGGHVVLPLLQAAVVPPSWVSNAQFLAGYGVAQAVPGPLFTFAAYLGAVERPTPHGALGAALALVAIFLPGFLLVVVVATLPLWRTLRRRPAVGAALRGVNAVVVGL